jgi:hypothetical protein
MWGKWNGMKGMVGNVLVMLEVSGDVVGVHRFCFTEEL